MSQFPQTKSLVEAIDRGLSIAREYPHVQVGPLHLLKSLLVEDVGAGVRLTELAGVNVHEVRAHLDAALDDLPRAPHSVEAPPFSGPLKAALQHAETECQQLEDAKVDDVHALLALTSAHGGLAKPLRDALGYQRRSMLDAIRKLRVAEAVAGPAGSPGARAGTSLPGSLEYCEDLTAKAERGELDPVFGRQREIARLAEILARRRKNNAIVVGEPGTGKTAVVEGLALLLCSGEAPPHLDKVRVHSLDLAGMVAGAKYKGEFEERFKKLLVELARKRDEAILFIDEIHNLLGVGKGGGGIDAANMLKPALARGELRIVGATTIAEYRKTIAEDTAFARRFVRLDIKEPDDDTTRVILDGLAPVYARHHEVEFGPDALDAAIRLSRRYLTGRFLPDKAVDLLDESAADVRILAQVARAYLQAERGPASDRARRDFEEAVASRMLPLPEGGEPALTDLAQRYSQTRVDGDAVARRVALATDIPVQRMTLSEREKLLHLEDHLHRRIIGQDEPIAAVADAVRRARTGLKQRPSQPNGSFLFLGPTGTGKTELAKALAEFLFGDENALIRIDMTEYREQYTVKRLIGADPGLIGYEQGGALTEALLRKPFSVVLFDEIDKAHPNCLDILLPMLDDGRLTDGKSNTIDCSNTVVILTSNYAGPWIAEQFRTAGRVDRDQLVARLLRPGADQRPGEIGFRPELINRFDDYQVFHPLSAEQVRKIADLQVDRMIRTIGAQGIRVEVDPQARDIIAREGFDPDMGGRPIRRTIDRLIGNPLARALAVEEPVPGTIVDVGVEDGAIRVTIRPTA